MVWVIVRVDGTGLLLARLTRRHPGVQVHQVIGPPRHGIHPSASRIQGLGRLRTWILVKAMQRRLGRAVHVRRSRHDLVIHVGVPPDAIHSDQLRLLMQHEHRFEAPYLRYDHGKVYVHLKPKPGTDVADLLRRLPGLDTSQVPVVDLSPWHGLVPAIPDEGPATSTRLPGSSH